MLKILQAGFQQHMNCELSHVHLDLEKAEEPNCQHTLDHRKSKRIPKKKKKTSISALLTMPKPLTVWNTINCGKFQERWEYQTT